MDINDAVKRSRDNEPFSKEQLTELLSLPPDSLDSYEIMAEARRISSELTGNKAEVHAQLALNLAPCPKNCKFCSFAEINNVFKESSKLSVEDAVHYARLLESEGTNCVYAMTTANYDFGEFLEVSGEIRKSLKPETVLIANVGDKTPKQSVQLKEAGFQGVYHALRLREGTDTSINPKKRLESIDNFREAGLSVGTCVEPVGPEHTNEEIAEMILLTSSFKPAYSGSGRRIRIPGTELEKYGMISELRMAQMVAITRLGVSRDVMGNCTHEPCTVGAMAGANLFWAEVGANPRDVKEKTEDGRGSTVDLCKKYYEETEWGILEGPSRYMM